MMPFYRRNKVVAGFDRRGKAPGSSPSFPHGSGGLSVRARRRGRERGSAALVVFILLSLMVGLVLANAQALHHLKQELRLIEKRQLKKYEMSPKLPIKRPIEVERPVAS
jgi:hypothetical protein